MKTAMTPTVFVIDDDESVRSAVVELLQLAGLHSEAFPNSREFLSRQPEEGPSCLVLDVRLPGKTGLEFQRELAASGIEIPIIFITGHGDIPMSVRAMKSGALDFLTKPFQPTELLQAVHQALERDRTRREHARELEQLWDRYAKLSPREREVMQCVVRGMLNKQIAAELGTQEGTVKAHRSKVMQKMNAGSVAELVRMSVALKSRQKRSNPA